LGLLPFLLLLPYYCGYATWTFSDWGPSGGVLYPWTIYGLRDFSGWTGADQWAFDHIPKVLLPLTLDPGPAPGISHHALLGPLTNLIIGAVIAVCILASARFANLGEQPPQSQGKGALFDSTSTI
jgi:hypothetical protein